MKIAEFYAKNLEEVQRPEMLPRMADLKRYGALCDTIIEFGTRGGCSTSAFLCGGAKVISYDLQDPWFQCPTDAEQQWSFVKADTSKLDTIPNCDLLFFDTVHHEEQLRAELKHADKVRKYLMFHDVIEWGWRGECDKRGINYAIWDFIMANTQWVIHEYLVDRWGLLVLKRK